MAYDGGGVHLMEGSKASGNGVRVVILSRGFPAVGLRPEDLRAAGLRCVRVSSAYEAAAELLAEPSAALVIELGLLHGPHTRLLEIARDLDVEMLALGTLAAGASADDLSGLRLLSRSEVPAVLRKLGLAPAPIAEQPETPSGPSDVEPHPAKLVPKHPARKASPEHAKRTIATAPQASTSPPSVPRARGLGPADAGQVRAPSTGELPSGENAAPRDLLTPEELSALLEDDR